MHSNIAFHNVEQLKLQILQRRYRREGSNGLASWKERVSWKASERWRTKEEGEIEEPEMRFMDRVEQDLKEKNLDMSFAPNRDAWNRLITTPLDW